MTRVERLTALLREALWYVADHQESQPNEETSMLLTRIEFALNGEEGADQ